MIWAIIVIFLIGFIVVVAAIRASGEITKREELEEAWKSKIE